MLGKYQRNGQALLKHLISQMDRGGVAVHPQEEGECIRHCGECQTFTANVEDLQGTTAKPTCSPDLSAGPSTISNQQVFCIPAISVHCAILWTKKRKGGSLLVQ